MNNLYIVESPEKANLLKEFGVNAIFTLGHITELDLLDDFFTTGNKDLTALKKSIKIIPKKSNFSFVENTIKNFKGNIVCGTDPDTEGEMIAYAIYKICQKYNKNFIRNPLYGITNKHLNNFLNLKNTRKLNINLINNGISRIIFDKILYNVFSRELEKEFNKKIKLGRIQHSILMLIDKYKNYIRYNISETFNFISKKELNIKNIEVNKSYKILKVNKPYNTVSLMLDSLQKLNFKSSNQVISILQKLYYDKAISYPRTTGTVLEETSYKMLYNKIKKSSKYPLIDPIFTNEYEKALSPFKIITEYTGDMFNVYKLIMQRSIAYLIRPYLSDSIKIELVTDNNEIKILELLYDNKKIISTFYTPNYLISDKDNIELFKIGYGLDEYHIIKLLSERYNIGRPSTYSYIIEHMKNKELVEITNYYANIINQDLINFLNQKFPYLTLDFYSEITKDFNFIISGIQEPFFPIKKLLNYLKNKNNINIDKVDFNDYDKTEEIEIEYKNLWEYNNQNNEKRMNLKNKNIFID